MQFDSLELQKNIEEKRLVYGHKFGNFLAKITFKLTKFLQNIVKSENFAFYGCCLIFLISILVRSGRDIGHDTGAYLEMGGKILAGGKYYRDFFEGNFPLVLYLSVIPHILAKIFAIDIVIAAEIFYNFIGLAAIIASNLILKRSTLYNDNRSFYNLILLAFSAGYFLRIFTLQYNEFGTKASYLLLFSYPYIACQFPTKATITVAKKLIAGILAGLIFCVKPHYFLLVAAFEIVKIFDKKSIKPAISLANFTSLIVISCYLLLMLKYCPEYFESIAALKGLYIAYKSPMIWLVNIFSIFVFNIAPALLLVILTFDLIYQNQYLRLLLITLVGAILIAIAEGLDAYDQITSFYSLALPLLTVIFYLVIWQNKINFRQNWFLILSIVIASQFDIDSFFQLAMQLVVLWWLIFLLISFNFRKFFKNNLTSHHFLGRRNLGKIRDIILLNNHYLKIVFIVLLTATNALSSSKYYQIIYLLCLLIFLLMILGAEKLHQNLISKKYYSKITVIVITVIFSKYLSFMLAGIFNHQNLYAAKFKSSNYSNSAIIRIINQYVKDDKKQPIIIGYGIYDSYPILTYSHKKNPLPSHAFDALEENINEAIKYNYNKKSDYKILKTAIFYGRNQDEIKAKEYLFTRLKMAMNNQDNSLLIIYKKHYLDYSNCRISFLEYYFQDDDFRKIFSKNYHFLNRVIYAKSANSKDNIKFFKSDGIGNNNLEILKKDLKNIVTDVEIYARN